MDNDELIDRSGNDIKVEKNPDKVCIDDSESDDESNNSNSVENVNASKEELEVFDKEAGIVEFKKISKEQVSYNNKLTDEKWKVLHPDIQNQPKLDNVDDLMILSLKPLMDNI